ncbi:MAG: glycosyltransferase [Acidimicrobiales bacterium]|jgi:dolichyl-phosphate beta-glucosyltransferase|nr:glycosyl transferase family 2 [Acidimicrobiaceae bacterium]|tara:strand:- start:201 stop:932 length:732 start_codon:yes stop_codon:yes gene_type:complete
MTDRRISVILPAYRAAPLVAEAIQRIRDDVQPAEVEIIVVDDGSKDETANIARESGADEVIELTQNRGKGEAVRRGMAAASGSYLVFTDVDLAYRPSQIMNIVEALERGADVALGSRRHSESEENGPPSPIREQGSRVFNRLTRLFLPGPHLDTQCGLKGFTFQAAQSVFPISRISGFAFDVEVLFLARRFDMEIVEIPVVVDHLEQSTVRFIPQAIRMLWDVARVRLWSMTRRYNHAPPQGG